MTDHSALITANARRWANAKLIRNVVSISRSLVAAKARYKAVESRTGVPWFIVAVIHEREASQRWDTQLGQGDPLNKASVHVPKGRGPFWTWEDGAVDALVNCPPFAAHWKDWSPGGALTLLERYNGLGYSVRNLPSPYVWAGTDQYKSGKFTSDGKFNPDVVDAQPGCAALIKTMMTFDRSIAFGAVPVEPPSAPKPIPEPPKPQPEPPTNWWTLILSIIRQIFGRN